MLKEVQPKAQKIAEHQRKYEQKREEHEIKERIERVKKAREEHERVQREEEARRQSGSQYGSFPGGFPGEMPGMGGGIPGMAGMPGLNEILSDPEVLENPRDGGAGWAAGSRSYGGLPGCGPEPSKYVKISEQPKGYESPQ